MIKFEFYFLLFVIYSFLGWFIEKVSCSIKEKKIVSRGFLVGPLCTIYGWGAILMIFFLNKYIDSPIILFVMGTFICSVLEYFTSFIMEKIFNTRWWDYSNRKFNVNGRICLANAFCFGFMGVLLLYYINPFLLKLLKIIPVNMLNIIFYTLLILLIIDFVISFATVFSFTNTVKLVKKDASNEINKKVLKKIEEGKSIFRKRLVKAFPHFNVLEKKKK